MCHQPFPHTGAHTIINPSTNRDTARQHSDTQANEDSDCTNSYQFADHHRCCYSHHAS